ncbi:DUF2958 domain-containing protein [Methylobacterium sp. GC_Met_2]|uniref:DUF2958 domain-containing protein n=1 Tax=Methylobacterium sp. GC_Met_2 TaxID=2937376 RepID=UPI00226B2DD4|nr:DUF2958 domain-containing protein [Methylobacterium sp. GC_Met_2]
MILFTKPQLAKLLANGTATAAALAAGREPPDHKPVVKLFTPDAAASWLLTEIDPEEPNIAFGLCDLGMQCAEIGSVSLAKLRALRGRLRLPVERDRHFEATHPLSVYARASMVHDCIVTDPARLDRAAAEPVN